MTAAAALSVNVSGEGHLPLDEQFLRHNTFGDKSLRDEIVKLFTLQLEQSRVRIVDAQSAQDWRFVMHTLKGAAAAVGAVELAKLAEGWEAAGCPDGDGSRSAVLIRYDLAQVAFVMAAGQSDAA